MAGKREGLKHSDLDNEETTRSGLFMEQLRIVKEMREHDRKQGRNDLNVRPRYMVWENVPGAFSSPGGGDKGKDFQTVLTEIVRVVEPDAPDVPLPDKGAWEHAGCIYGEMGNWSIAYRVHDAQYWGVPQRRKRIALVADFNGISAAEILFDTQLRGETEDSEPDKTFGDSGAGDRPEIQSVEQSVSWDSEQSGAQGQGTPESPAGRADGTGERGASGPESLSFQERAGRRGGVRDCSYNMNEQEHCQPSTTNPSSPQPFGISSMDSNGMKGDNPKVGFYEADTSKTLDLTGGNPACNQGGWQSLQPLIAETGQKIPFVNGTLQAKEQGQNLNSNNVVRVPKQDSFKTQAGDGGMRARQAKRSELHRGGYDE